MQVWEKVQTRPVGYHSLTRPRVLQDRPCDGGCSGSYSHPGVLQDRPCDGDALLLTAAQLDAALANLIMGGGVKLKKRLVPCPHPVHTVVTAIPSQPPSPSPSRPPPHHLLPLSTHTPVCRSPQAGDRQRRVRWPHVLRPRPAPQRRRGGPLRCCRRSTSQTASAPEWVLGRQA